MAKKNSAIGVDSGALPETTNRRRPPRRPRTFDNTSRSAKPCWRRVDRDAERPASAVRARRRPTPTAQWKSRWRMAGAAATASWTRAWNFS